MMRCKNAYVILIWFIFLSHSMLYSQIMSGKITYERKTNLYKKYKWNKDVKEWLKEEDKNKLDVFELSFNDSLSVFIEKETDVIDKMSWATNKNTVYQNFATNKRITDKKIWSEHLLVTDSVRKFNWKITEGKKTICGYTCRKAIWRANDSVSIYAWFCNEIIPSVGPESMVGLPGAILGLATEDGGVVYFAKSVETKSIEPMFLLSPKFKQKIYTTSDLKAQLIKEYGAEKWGKALIYNNFEIW